MQLGRDHLEQLVDRSDADRLKHGLAVCGLHDINVLDNPAASLEAAKAVGSDFVSFSYPLARDLSDPKQVSQLIVDLNEGDSTLLPGLTLHQVGGHSEGMTLVLFGEDDDASPTAAFWGDLIPTTHHIQTPYIMAYDIDVVRSFEQRSEWLERAADRGWIGLFYHDPLEAFGRIRRVGRKFAYEPVPSERLELAES